MESMFAMDLTHSVLAAELDLAIIAEPSENPQLTLVQLATVPLCVAMQADHPAAGRRSVSIEEFGNVGWMIFPRKAHPVIYDRVLDASRQAAVSPVELHHYVAPQEAVQLILENFGIAFMAKGVAEQIRNTEIAVRPLSQTALQVTSYLVLRADQSSRLVNEFGRAFLRKVLPNSKIEDASGQLSLGL
jgi:DNA-binding transcriptional LysR family regulator